MPASSAPAVLLRVPLREQTPAARMDVHQRADPKWDEAQRSASELARKHHAEAVATVF
jgi:hypothetical protein